MPERFSVDSHCRAQIADFARVERRLRDCPTIASLQAIKASLLGLATNTNVPVQEIARLIGRDQALTARLLRLVNSVFGGLSVKVTNIEEAIFFLGLRQVHDLALSAQVFEEMRISSDYTNNFCWEDIIRHTVASAILCREILSLSAGLRDDDTYYIIGLLQNIGKLVMLHVFPEELEISMSFCDGDPDDFEQHERQTFGWSHADIGALYLSHHGLPIEIIEAVFFHHKPHLAPTHQKFAAGAQLADRIARYAGFSCSFEPQPYHVFGYWEEKPVWKMLFGKSGANWKIAGSTISECLQRLPVLTRGLTKT